MQCNSFYDFLMDTYLLARLAGWTCPGSALAWSESTKCQTAWHSQQPAKLKDLNYWRKYCHWKTQAAGTFIKLPGISWKFTPSLRGIYQRPFKQSNKHSVTRCFYHACLALTGSLFPQQTTCHKPGDRNHSFTRKSDNLTSSKQTF